MWREAKVKKHTLLSTNVNKVMAGHTCQGHKVQPAWSTKLHKYRQLKTLISDTYAQIHQKMRSNIFENVLIVILKVKYLIKILFQTIIKCSMSSQNKYK